MQLAILNNEIASPQLTKLRVVDTLSNQLYHKPRRNAHKLMTSFLFGFDNQIVSLVYQLVSANDHIGIPCFNADPSVGVHILKLCMERNGGISINSVMLCLTIIILLGKNFKTF